MVIVADLQAQPQLLRSLASAEEGREPFRHWTFRDVLPAEIAGEIRSLPFAAPEIGDTAGRRETHNTSRLFFGTRAQARHPVCAVVAAAYQDERTIARLESLCDVSLSGSFLRIEYCLDTPGFWLEPHTDIGAKLFTHLVYLSTEPGSEAWGTDLLAPDGRLVARAEATPNSGLIFVPSHNSWHGFAPRPMTGVRRTLIVNYVRDEWRARHELAYPDEPVGS
jgi:hypothetical protein